MATYNVSVTQSIETQPDNVAAGGTMEYVISNPLGVDSYFTLETVPNANGAYDSSSPKNTSGSYTLGSGIRELIQNDYFASVIVSPGGGTLTLVPAVDVTGSTLRLNGVGYTDVTIAPSVVYLLDLYPNATTAYSIRKLNSTYTGNCLRVRRSSDNTEQDIGFDGNGNLDESALTTFVGAGNGFVTTWYDQSGNSRNATQSTAANQPIIVSSGTIQKVNNKPCLKNTTDTQVLNFSNVAINSSFGVMSNNGGLYMYISNASANYFGFAFNGSGINSFNNVGTPNVWINSITHTVGTAGSFYTATQGQKLLSITDATSPAGNVNTLGYSNSPSGGIKMAFLQEVINYSTSQSSNRTGIESNINTYYQIY